MTEFIRVRAANGSEISVPATYEQAFEMTPLKKPAADRFGRPLPTKPRVNTRQSANSAEASPAEAQSPSKEK